MIVSRAEISNCEPDTIALRALERVPNPLGRVVSVSILALFLVVVFVRGERSVLLICGIATILLGIRLFLAVRPIVKLVTLRFDHLGLYINDLPVPAAEFRSLQLYFYPVGRGVRNSQRLKASIRGLNRVLDLTFESAEEAAMFMRSIKRHSLHPLGLVLKKDERKSDSVQECKP